MFELFYLIFFHVQVKLLKKNWPLCKDMPIIRTGPVCKKQTPSFQASNSSFSPKEATEKTNEDNEKPSFQKGLELKTGVPIEPPRQGKMYAVFR